MNPEQNGFTSNVFPVTPVNIGGVEEHIVVGGRDKFQLLGFALSGIQQIGVIGWGSQGPAQAQNLRDSLSATTIKVKVGLQEWSSSKEKARAAGFTEENGTLGEMYEVISESDLVILLISDSAQVENWSRISQHIKCGAILGLSHGFLLGHLESINKYFDGNYSVIGVCPKGMGPSVRRLYEQGEATNSAGINCSFAVEKDLDGRATDVALAWAIALGAPFVFQTTLRDEYRSDIFGERGVLLGGVHGMVEALYRAYCGTGQSRQGAFYDSVEYVTSTLSPIISRHGIIGVYNNMPNDAKPDFESAFNSAYLPCYVLLREIYNEVASGNEIRSVVMAGERLKQFPMGNIADTEMWRIGTVARMNRNEIPQEAGIFCAYTAGVYCAMMMAQIDVLLLQGHRFSEVCNETVIEAVDSLNPYMHARGVDYMVDNCSTTARLGTRKWGPRFDHIIMQQVVNNLPIKQPVTDFWNSKCKEHPIHEALAVCATMRPSVDIAVS